MFKTLRLYYGLSLRRQFLLVLTLALSLYSWLMMRFFKRYAHFGKKNPKKPIVNRQSNQSSIANDFRWAIFVVSKNVFWENVCRHQAYQAMLLCKFYGIQYKVFVGFKKNEEGKINGHAWTMAQGEMITGFCNPDEYIVQAVYGN